MAYSIQTYNNGNPSYNRNARTGSIKYIVVHYTANGSPDTPNAAKNNCIYFSGGDRQASAHYFIDNSSIWCFADPAKWSCWHVGDGSGKYGITNQNSIGIEVIQNGNKAFSQEEINKLAWLVKKLMKQFSIPAVNVVRHYDASRKSCPLYYTPNGAGGDTAWVGLQKQITSGATNIVSLRDKVVEKAKSQLGVRYWTMHTGPKGSSSEGWGCAMLAAWCLNQVLGTNYYGSCWNFWGDAIGAPMYNQGGGEFVETNNPQPGDLVLYFNPGANVGYSTSAAHTAIYIGDGKVIGAWCISYPGASDYMKGGSVRTTTVAGQTHGGPIRYIRCKRLETDYVPSTPEVDYSKEMFKLNKTVTVKSTTLAVRDKPSTKTGKVVARYNKGDKIILDGVVFGDDGYLWGTYIGASSGKRRYCAMGTHELVSV